MTIILKQQHLDRFSFRAALGASCEYLERSTGTKPHTVLFLDINGTTHRQGGHEHHPELGANLVHAIRNGVMVIPTTDNPDSGVDAWMRFTGVPLHLLPVRIIDHGTQVVVRVPGRRKYVHHLEHPVSLRRLESAYAHLNAAMMRRVRELGLTALNGHLTTVPQAKPHNGDHGVVVRDAHRKLALDLNLRVRGQDGRLNGGCPVRSKELGAHALEIAERNGIGTRDAEIFNHFIFFPAAEMVTTTKAAGAEEVRRFLPGYIQRFVQVGDAANEVGMRHVVDEGYAPLATKHARNHGVVELACGAKDGAVVELVSRYILPEQGLAVAV